MLANGCAYPLDACGEPARETWVNGTLVDSTGALVAHARVMLAEVRYGRPPAGLSIGVIGPSTPENYGGPLQDRVVSARLEGPDGRVLFDLPIRFASNSAVFASFDTVLAAPREADALGRILLTRRAVVHMETRPPTPGPARIVLDRVERGDREFSRARCS
jgi:hypothetical protein